MQIDTMEKAEPRVYYARASHLIVTISTPRKAITNGIAVDVGGKDVEFLALGDGWGRYITSDPTEIQVLDKCNMVVDAATYNDMTTPDKVKIQMEKDENIRLITQNSRLEAEIAELRAKAQKLPVQQQK